MRLNEMSVNVWP